MFGLQSRLIFGTPRPLRTVEPGPNLGGYAVRPLRLRTGGVPLLGWAGVPAEGTVARATLVYFAGRNEHPGWAPHIASYLPGWNVLAFAYRGRLGSAGRSGEREAVDDARRIHALALRAFGAPVALMGRSLGTAVAIRLACEVDPVGLVLASPFTCLADVLGPPWGTLARLGALRHPFRSIDVAHGVRAPTLVLLAETDARVPHDVSRRLVQALPRVHETVTIAGTTHRTLPRAQATLGRVAAFLLRLAPGGTDRAATASAPGPSDD